MYWSTGESGTSSSHQCPERAAFILSFRFRLFTLSFSFFDIVPCGEHGVGASSIADPSESPFFSSPSSSLGVSARFVPTVLPLGTAQRGLYFYCDDEVKAGESQWSQSSRTPP